VQHQEKIQLAQNVRISLPTGEKVGNFSHVTYVRERQKIIFIMYSK